MAMLLGQTSGRVTLCQKKNTRPQNITNSFVFSHRAALTRCRAHSGRSGLLDDVYQHETSRRSFLAAVPAAALSLFLHAHLTSPAQAAGPVYLTGEAKAAVDAAFKKYAPKAKAPALLRLVFHDAGTYSASGGDGGLNASCRFEFERPENFGLKRGWGVIEQVAKGLEGTAAAGKVSYADLIALGGAWAVAVTGGPVIQVPVGRQDAEGPDPEGRMPSEKATPAELKANFADKGLSVREMIVLSGAHTLGSKGFGDPVTFDNAYYSTLVEKPWLKMSGEMAEHIGLASDRALPDDPECLAIIKQYAADRTAFFDDFSAAYVKMTNLGVTWV